MSEEQTEFVWATVTAVGPLRVKLDGDSSALGFTPESLIDPLVLAVSDRVRCEVAKNRVIVHGHSNDSRYSRAEVVALLDAQNPVGSIKAFGGVTIPAGSPYLEIDGGEYSRTTYANLYNYLCPVIGDFTVTIASPGVFTLNSHGLVAGQKVWPTTTGSLPTGLSANTIYYVLAAGLTTNTFRLSTTNGGSAINTSGSQSGTHTLRLGTHGIGNGSTTFNVPQGGDYTLVGRKAGSAEFGFAGATAGAKTHSHPLSDLGQAALAWAASASAVFLRRISTTFTANAKTTANQTSLTGDSTSQSLGLGLTGTTDAGNSIQPSLAVIYGIRY